MTPLPSPPDTLSIALWATHVALPMADLDAWLAAVDAQLAAAAAAGAELLMLPEYACMQWLLFAPEGLRPDQEIAWMADVAEAALPQIEALARRHGVALLAGTTPAPRGSGHVNREYLNRAHLLLPDGRQFHQDKLCLTPTEQQPEAWTLVPGDQLHVVRWRGLRLAIVVCLDIELPALATRMQHLDLDLILVPSMTGRLSGYHRVAACARARAVELFTTVATVGTVGTLTRFDPPETNVAGAAVYLPCETALGSTGVAAQLDPIAESEGPGPLLIARDIPIGQIRRLRASGAAEAWPGPWEAGGVVVVEVAESAEVAGR
jgi:predicted amidohydrolase